MTRRKSDTAAEAAPAAEVQGSDPFAHIRTEMLESVGGLCPACGDFKPGVKIAPLARTIGVPSVTLSDYLKGKKEVGRVTLTRFINYLASLKTTTPEQDAALAEVASLD